MKSNSAIIDEKYLIPLGDKVKNVITVVSVIAGTAISTFGVLNGDPNKVLIGPVLAFGGSTYLAKIARHLTMNFARDGLKDLLMSNTENKTLSSLINDGAKTNNEMYQNNPNLSDARFIESKAASAGALMATVAFTALFFTTGAVTGSVITATAAGLGANNFLKELLFKRIKENTSNKHNMDIENKESTKRNSHRM